MAYPVVRCQRCGEIIPDPLRSDVKFCSNACRQAAYRDREREEESLTEQNVEAMIGRNPDLEPEMAILLRGAVALREAKLAAKLARRTVMAKPTDNRNGNVR